MIKRFILILSIILFPFSVYAGTYWVDDNGTETTWANCQSTSPMSGTSCCTLQTANINLVAGDTVYFRGGIYEIDDHPSDGGDPNKQGIKPSNSGLSGNIITYSAYPGESVSFVGINNRAFAVDINGKSYIKVHGITFTDFTRHLWILNGHYNEISHCSFVGVYNLDWIQWRGSTIYRGSTYNHIHDCAFGEYGKFTPNDVGVVFELGNESANDDGTSYNLIENSHFYRGGHHVMGMNGHHNVIRNNYIHNERWSPYGGEDWGNRVTFLMGSDGDDERNLIEGNRIAYGGECADDELGGSGGTLASRLHIIRRNMYYQNSMYAYVMKPYGGHGTVNDNHIYNNVFWYNGYSSTGPLKDWWLWHYSHGLFIPTEGSLTQNNRIKNNIFYDNKNYYGAGIPIISYTEAEPTLQIISNNWKGGVDGDPKFVNISGMPDPDNETQFDFSLQSSSLCINAGAHLTQANGSGSGSTTLIVDDAGYFQDGWNEIVNADYIAIGTVSNTVQISSINYDTNTITLASAMTWSNNASIWLFKDSNGDVVLNGTAPDMGAHEYQPLVVSSTNWTITGQTVTYSITGAPANYTVHTVVGFTATGGTSPAYFSITYPSLPANPVFYKVVNGVWKQIHPVNQSIGIRSITLNGNTLSFTLADNSDCDSDATVGAISGPIVVGSVGGGSVPSSGGDNVVVSSGGGCFIATATYGSYLDSHVKVLQDFRDKYLLTNFAGTKIVSLYYRYSPPVANFISEHEKLKFITRCLITPVVYVVSYPYAVLFLFFLFIIVLFGRKRKTEVGPMSRTGYTAI